MSYGTAVSSTHTEVKKTESPRLIQPDGAVLGEDIRPDTPVESHNLKGLGSNSVVATKEHAGQKRKRVWPALSSGTDF
jgi:hypothetical protein